MKRHYYLVLVILISAISCQPIEPQIVTSHQIDAQGATSAELFIRMLKGNLNVSSGPISGIIATNYHYNSPFYRPKLDYILEDKKGKLSLDQQYEPSISTFPTMADGLNQWQVTLNPQIPTQLNLVLNEGSGTFNTAQLNLQRLKLDLREADFTLRLGEPHEALMVVLVNNISGQVNITLPTGVGTKVITDRGAQKLTVEGLKSDDQGYVSPDYEDSAKKIVLDIRSTHGPVHIQ